MNMWKFTFILVLFMFSTTVAGNCGTSPDPRYDSAGYAEWCNCMGGWVDYSAGVGCSGATGPRQESGPGASKSGNGELCNECDEALVNDITVGLQSSARIRTYVNHSRAKYANCIQLLGRGCSCGEQLYDNIPLACDRYVEDSSYAACVEELVNDARYSCQ